MLAISVILTYVIIGIPLYLFSRTKMQSNELAFTIKKNQIDFLYELNDVVYTVFEKVHFANLKPLINFKDTIKIEDQRVEILSHFEYTIPRKVMCDTVNEKLSRGVLINNCSLKDLFAYEIAHILLNNRQPCKSIEEFRIQVDEKLKILCEKENIVINEYNIDINDRIFQSWSIENCHEMIC